MKKNFFSNYFSFVKKKKENIISEKNDFIKKNSQFNDELKKTVSISNMDDKASNQSNITSKNLLINSIIDVAQKSNFDCDDHICNKDNIKDTSNIKKINIENNISNLEKSSFLFSNKFMKNLRSHLKKTRDYLGLEIKNIFSKYHVDQILFDKLEEKLLLSDVGFKTTNLIINDLKSVVTFNKLKKTEEVYDILKSQMLEILSVVEKPINLGQCLPFIILIVGVNGVGKTTTIGKLAAQYKQSGKSVMLAAGDTFRAAAVEQLQAWGLKNNISVIAQHTHADPAAVIFDAIKSAQAKKIDILIIDTAGRIHNKSYLMNELKKIKRVIKKLDILAPHEVILIVDACTGQNTIQQTKLFHESLNLTGIIITKLDGTAKGGVVFSIANEFSIPIYYIGIGERITDLKVFNSLEFIKSIF